MILYAHRGNRFGPNMFENDPLYLAEAIEDGFNVEADIWYVKGDLWFGHSWPTYMIPDKWLLLYADSTIFHCKNIEAIQAMQQAGHHYFWHQEDEYALTSEKYVWVYPGREYPKTNQFIACEPTMIDLPASLLAIHGICSDYVDVLRQKKEVLCPTLP